jgi:acyl-CoA synthetase (AMP-forming)/AMP-acid ligase II
MRLSDYVWRGERLFRSHLAIEDANRSVSFAGLAAEVRDVCNTFAGWGFGPGDRVAVVSKNSIEYAELYFAASELGVALTPVNWRLRADEIRRILEDSGATAVFTGPEFVETIDSIATQLPETTLCIALEGTAPTGKPWRGTKRRNQMQAAFLSATTENTVAVQMYTSGTTGAPRGAMLTNRNLRSMVASWLIELPLRELRHRFLQVSPLFHVGGVLMLLSNVCAGSSLILLPEFSPGAAAEALAEREISHALFVPSMIRLLLDEVGDDLRCPTLRTIVYGAAPMPVSLLEESIRAFGCSFLQGYGLTETSGVLTVLRPEDHQWKPSDPPPSRLASAGREVQCCHVLVVHPDGTPVKPGEVGEIIARGDNIMTGYYGTPEATEAAITVGWLHTGDLATVDDDGFIYIVDRKKDMIIVGGENVYPKEIESVLISHAAVAEAAVVGIPHDVWGEEILAVVAVKPGQIPTDRELIQFCVTRLARFKCPTRIEFRTELPRNSAGKVLKREIQAPFWLGRERRV